MIPIPGTCTEYEYLKLQYALQSSSVCLDQLVSLMGLIGHAIMMLCQGGLGLGSFQVVCHSLLVSFRVSKSVNFKGEVTKKELIVLTLCKSLPTCLLGLIVWLGMWMIYKESANKVFLQGVVAGSQ